MTTTFTPSESILQAEAWYKPSISPLTRAEIDEGSATVVLSHTTLEESLQRLRAWILAATPGLFKIRDIGAAEGSKLEQLLACEGLRPRYDWYSEDRTAVFKMLSWVHDTPADWFILELPGLTNELRQACFCGTPTLSSIGSGGTKHTDGGRKEPDKGVMLTLLFEAGLPEGVSGPALVGIPFPRIVWETSYSQSEEDARRKICSQLMFSERHTQVAILCNMKYKVTEKLDFWATIEIWVRIEKEDDMDARFPFEITPFEHTPRATTTSSAHGAGGGGDNASSESPVLSSHSASSTSAVSEADETRVEEVWPEQAPTIRRRWGPAVLVNENPNSKGAPQSLPRPGEALPLHVYDFLRVCPFHDTEEYWMADRELLLPLDALKSQIELTVAVTRNGLKAERLKAERLKQRATGDLQPTAPSTRAKRLNPLADGRGSKRQRPE
ncbi:hypothetical protein FRC07_001879 [Ceratobasidium sp. 392]|nr:hypothetical protein FRC07_001879 [Ceratobasidium sp. 392]